MKVTLCLDSLTLTTRNNKKKKCKKRNACWAKERNLSKIYGSPHLIIKVRSE